MKQYLELLQYVLDNGIEKGDRTGTGTISSFGHHMRFDLSQGFPLVTTKKVSFRLIVHELLWFLSGDTNIKYLKDNNVKIWNEWANKDGDLGPIYGYQWRNWDRSISMGKVFISSMDYFDKCILKILGLLLVIRVLFFDNLLSTIIYYISELICIVFLIFSYNVISQFHRVDQIKSVANLIKTNPNSRRILVSAWNPSFLPDESISPQENVKNGKMALPPCHTLFQFYVADGKLSCQLYQRSGDLFLGVPFNIASYSLLTMMIAQVCDLEPGEFVHVIGDAHIYKNHLEQVREQLSREPKELPTVKINPDVKDIFNFKFEDFELQNYNPHPHIKGAISV